jgi:hypothetical protein
VSRAYLLDTIESARDQQATQITVPLVDVATALDQLESLEAWARMACSALRNPHMVHGDRVADRCPVQEAQP